MPKKKFQLALISIISFGFILILILNLGVVGNQCTNLTGLIEAHQAEERGGGAQSRDVRRQEQDGQRGSRVLRGPHRQQRHCQEVSGMS